MKEINIAATLVAKRREKGITQDELAEYIGVSKASVSKWETGQSYPDITFLPQLAAYFNISIDELMNYTPQMIKEDIRKLYQKLASLFAETSFDNALAECRSVIKKYYSCFPLLYQMAALLVNHHMLAGSEDEKETILREAVRLCVRVKTESGDVWLSKDAAEMQAVCCMMLKEPQTVLELLGEAIHPYTPEECLISQAYYLMGNMTKAKETLQIGLFQRLLSFVEVAVNYFGLCSIDDTDKAEEIIKRILPVMDAFQMDKLNPNMSVKLYTGRAQMYCTNGQTERTLEMLEGYVELCVNGFFPYTLHGDTFFDSIDVWLSDLDMGTEAPRSEKVIKESMLRDVLLNPVFSTLENEPKYKNAVQKLKEFIGGN